MYITLSNEYLTAVLTTKGAQVRSIKSKEGFQYLWQGRSWSKHAPLLFPVCGRLKNQKYTYNGKEYSMPPHGFIGGVDFTPVYTSETSAIVSYSSNKSSYSIYPFNFTFVARYTLLKNTLLAEFTVTNNGKDSMPHMFGWHPGFVLPGKQPINSFKLHFENAGDVMIHPLREGTAFTSGESNPFALNDGTYYLNEEEIYSNDTLILSGTGGVAALRCDDSNFGVDLHYSSNLPYFCIWKHPSSKSRFICLEPWTDIPQDGLCDENFDTRKMQRLDPKESATYRYAVEFK